MYELTQMAHLVFFGLLLFTKQRRTAAFLVAAALFYLAFNNSLLVFGQGVYLARGLIDLATAYAIFYFTANRSQPLILSVFVFVHVAAWFEYPTSSRVIYDWYGDITNALNVAQILVMWRAVGELAGLDNRRISAIFGWKSDSQNLLQGPHISKKEK